jgi:hypothetical protein
MDFFYHIIWEKGLFTFLLLFTYKVLKLAFVCLNSHLRIQIFWKSRVAPDPRVNTYLLNLCLGKPGVTSSSVGDPDPEPCFWVCRIRIHWSELRLRILFFSHKCFARTERLLPK